MPSLQEGSDRSQHVSSIPCAAPHVVWHIYGTAQQFTPSLVGRDLSASLQKQATTNYAGHDSQAVYVAGYSMAKAREI